MRHWRIRRTKTPTDARIPLFTALCDGNLSTVRRYFRERPDAISLPLFRAWDDNLSRVLYDSSPPLPPSTGATCLHVSAWQGQTQIVGWLLQQGAQCTIEDAFGRTPIFVARGQLCRRIMWPYADAQATESEERQKSECRGATLLELDAVRKVVLPLSDEATDRLAHSECAICMVAFEDKEEGAVSIMPCDHAFCSSCLERWLCKVRSCPMCRTPLVAAK